MSNRFLFNSNDKDFFLKKRNGFYFLIFLFSNYNLFWNSFSANWNSVSQCQISSFCNSNDKEYFAFLFKPYFLLHFQIYKLDSVPFAESAAFSKAMNANAMVWMPPSLSRNHKHFEFSTKRKLCKDVKYQRACMSIMLDLEIGALSNSILEEKIGKTSPSVLFVQCLLLHIY